MNPAAVRPIPETPAELVARLTSDGLASLRADVDAGRREHALKSLDERGRAQELVRDQYAGRYPLELVQNANDAAGSQGATGGRLQFVLSDNALIVADEGSGFDNEQVNAICSLGRSSKDPRKSIGYKGLGFKSVNEITCKPQVISPQVRFGFDHQRLRRYVEEIAGELSVDMRLPDYAFPFPAVQEELGADWEIIERLLDDGFRTVLRLPFLPEVERGVVEGHIIDTILPQLLLFLDSTSQISIVGTRCDFVATVVREPSSGYEDILLEANGETKHYLMFSDSVAIPQRHLVEDLGEAWSRVEAVRLSAAIPLDSDELPVSRTSESLHVYFPTEEMTGLPFILSADFQTELDRRRISRTAQAAPYNEWLLAELATFLAARVFPLLYEHINDHSRVFDILVSTGPLNKWGAHFRSLLVQKLAANNLVPCCDGNLRKPAEVKLLPDSVGNIVFAQSLLPHWRHLAEASLDGDSSVRKMLSIEFGVTAYSVGQVIKGLELPPEGLVNEYYEFLVNWSKAGNWGFAALLKDIKCVRLVDGSWCSPSELVFFPRQRGGVGFPEDLHVPLADIPAVEDAKELLEASGVQPFEWRLLIPDFLMPILRDPAKKQELRDVAMMALRDYYQSERGTDEAIRSVVRQALVRVQSATGETLALRPAGATYFGANWVPTGGLLERIYGSFGKPEFLAEEMTSDIDEQRGRVSFYAWLGVEAKPRRVDLARESLLGAQASGASASRAQLNRWLGSESYRLASVCVQGHPNSQVLESSPSVDRIDDVIESNDWDRNRALWELLARNWDEYKASLTANFRCTASAHRGERNRPFASAFSSTLRDREWVPAQVGDRRTLAQPELVWLTSPQTSATVLHRLTILAPTPGTSRSICESLGLIDVERPSALQLMSLLDNLEADSLDSPGDLLTTIAVVARWAMAKLDSIITPADIEGQSAVPLLARRAGALIFDPNPYFTESLLLAETWEDQVPIFDGDRDLRRLATVLGLRILDHEVRTEPVLLGRDAVAEVKVSRHLHNVGPYLLALATQNAPWQESGIRDGLLTLDIVCVQHLSLKYTLGDTTRERDDPSTYLDWHRDLAKSGAGAAYFELDAESGMVDWFSFGPQLAEFFGMPALGDGFGVLLDASPSSRHRFALSRRISPAMIESARMLLEAGPAKESVKVADAEVEVEDVDDMKTGSAPEDACGPEAEANMQHRSDQVTTVVDFDSENSQTGIWKGAPGGEAGRGGASSSSSGACASPDAVSLATTGLVSSLPGARGHKSEGSASPMDSLQSAGDDEQNRFYSYVVPAGTREARMARRADNPAPEVDRAGVDIVLAYERDAGRIPEEQEHGNPGFDVLSRSGNGSVVRIIEVKSTSGRWAERGVPVSSTQMGENQQRGDEFWLYVVEYAMEPAKARVVAIQNPIAKAEYFVFDRGWDVLGE